MDSFEAPCTDCQCPQMDAAVDALNKHLCEPPRRDRTTKQFRLVYKVPNDEQDHSYELRHATSFFLYLTPVQYEADSDRETFGYEGAFDESTLLNGRISPQDKLLFVDAMRFFGAFKTETKEPGLIFYTRQEFDL